jgi:hypothetical protein
LVWKDCRKEEKNGDVLSTDPYKMERIPEDNEEEIHGFVYFNL